MRVLGYTTLALGLALAACTGHRNVAEDIAQQLRSGATQVDMAHAADFVWDEMFVFGPYYPKDATCRTLNLDASHCSSAGISNVDEGEFLLVFMHRGAVSETARLPRRIANFDEGDRCLARGIRKDVSAFTVERKPGIYLVCR